MTMRALHVLESLAPGGIETTFLNVLRVWRTSRRFGATAQHDVLAFSGGALEDGFRKAATTLFITPRLDEIEEIVRTGYDVVHVLSERCAYRLLPWLAAQQRGAIVYGKGYDLGGMFRASDGLRWQADESALFAADAVTFTTRALADSFEQPPSTTVLGKAADISRFLKIAREYPPEGGSHSCSLRGANPAETGSHDGKVRIVCVANLHPRKRIGDLVHALAKVRNTVPDACLRIVGNGSIAEAERIMNTAVDCGVADAVEIVGFRHDVLGDLTGSRVFALTSSCEGVSTAMLEAMAAALPVVVTRVGHLSDVVADGVHGFLVAPGDIDALAARLTLLLTDGDLARRMGAAGRQRAIEFDVDLVAVRLLDVLERAAASASADQTAGEAVA